MSPETPRKHKFSMLDLYGDVTMEGWPPFFQGGFLSSVVNSQNSSTHHASKLQSPTSLALTKCGRTCTPTDCRDHRIGIDRDTTNSVSSLKQLLCVPLSVNGAVSLSSWYRPRCTLQWSCQISQLKKVMRDGGLPLSRYDSLGLRISTGIQRCMQCRCECKSV